MPYLLNNTRPPCIRDLRRPMYVLDMGWERMGEEARIKWLKTLKVTCELVAAEIKADLG